MGSSTRKKSSKKADFQKPKLKVGKARPKPTNFTNTSFKSKGISLARQSLTDVAPSASSQFTHHLSLLNSRSDTQRRDALAHLAHLIAALQVSAPLPQPISVLLPKLAPLLLDGSNSVRTALLKLFCGLQTAPQVRDADFEPHIEKLLLYIRAGMTHLAADIRVTAAETWLWALSIAGEEVVSCPGGWVRGLKTLLTALNWPVIPHPKSATIPVSAKSKASGWTSVSATTNTSGVITSKAGTQPIHLLTLLSAFLRAGLVESRVSSTNITPSFPLHNASAYLLPDRSNPYGYLNLFGEKRDEEGEVYQDCEERRGVFKRGGWERAVLAGVEGTRKEGGEVGRAGAKVGKAVTEGLRGSGEEARF